MTAHHVRYLCGILMVAMSMIPLFAVPAGADDYDGKVAYIRVANDGWGYELVTARLAGGATTVPLDQPALSRPAISPDGTEIAFISPLTDGTDGRFGLFVATINGTNLRRVSSSRFADYDPAWSPDGTRIAVSRDSSGSLDRQTCCAIRIIEADGTGAFNVPGTRGGINPAWSPDGSRLVYQQPEGLYVTDLDGSEQRRITGAGGAEPAWSPDGSTIAYLAPLATGGWELVTRRPNGGSREVRLSTQLQLESPTFAPDSETIYYVRYSGAGYDGRTQAALWMHHPDRGAAEVFTDATSPMILAALALRPATRHGCDANGDRRSELVIGAPSDDDSVTDGGVVTTLTGTATGVGAASLWHRNTPGIPGSAGSGDEFGTAVACGDFNGDGFSDLAIGAPGDGAGSVTVLPGTAAGFAAVGATEWSQSAPGIPGTGTAGDRWGEALATGDFDGDGFDDLAVGAPGTTGSVTVVYGSGGGLSSNGAELFSAADFGLAPLATDSFGASLDAGDLDADAYEDLIIGVPGANVGARAGAGAVAVAGGAATGLTGGRLRAWTQNSPGVAGIAQAGDELGASVGAGDLNGDGYDDLVAGAPGAGHGGINVMYGSADGESGAGDQVWKQNTPGIAGIGRGTDRFGTAVAVGDLDGDGFDDVAIGVPGSGPGAVNVIYGGTAGLTAAGNQIWKQNTPGVAGVAHVGDAFGRAVSIADYNGDGLDDLAVGVPGNGPGAVNVLYGSPVVGITAQGDEIIKQGRNGVPGTPTAGDRAGRAVL